MKRKYIFAGIGLSIAAVFGVLFSSGISITSLVGETSYGCSAYPFLC